MKRLRSWPPPPPAPAPPKPTPCETQLRPPEPETYRTPAGPSLEGLYAEVVRRVERLEEASAYEEQLEQRGVFARTLLVVVLSVLVGAVVTSVAQCSARAQPSLEGVSDPAAPSDGPEARRADTTAGGVGAALERALLSVVIDQRSGRVVAGHCREAPGGCEARIGRIARAIVYEARRAGIDPWLVAAIAVTESGLNSDALGGAGELGLMQLHPRSPWGRAALAACAHLRDYGERERCRGVQLLRQGVLLLARAVRRHGLERGLSAYHTGRPETESGRGEAYARRVLRRRLELEAAGVLE